MNIPQPPNYSEVESMSDSEVEAARQAIDSSTLELFRLYDDGAWPFQVDGRDTNALEYRRRDLHRIRRCQWAESLSEEQIRHEVGLRANELKEVRFEKDGQPRVLRYRMGGDVNETWYEKDGKPYLIRCLLHLIPPMKQEQESSSSIAAPVVPQAEVHKRGPGRPRKHPLPDPSIPKRPVGRPRKTSTSNQEPIVNGI